MFGEDEECITGSIVGFQDGHVITQKKQVPGSNKAGQACPDHGDVILPFWHT